MDTLQFYEAPFKHPITEDDIVLAGIKINNQPLDEIVEHYEMLGAEKGGLKIAVGRRAFNCIDYLYYELIGDDSPWFNRPGKAALLICDACLEPGCAPLDVEIEETDTEVIWHGFYNHNLGHVREDGTFVDYSVFPTYHFEKSVYNAALKILEEMYKRDVWIGEQPSIIGAITGDIIGSRFEFNNYKGKDFKLFTDDCEFTDDTVMTIAVAKAIMETAKIRPLADCLNDNEARDLLAGNTIKYMREIGQKYPYCGFGGMFYKWMFSDNPKPYNSYGNGAAMRVSPVGIIASGVREAECLAEIVTAVTHNHPEGIKGAKATAAAIALARRKASKEEIRKYITDRYYTLDFTIDEIRETYIHNETCQDTVPQAIDCFLESDSFEDAIRIAISLGGDSDTIAAITGAIAEAYYGVKIEMKWKAGRYLDDKLCAICDEWEKFAVEEWEMTYDEIKKTLDSIIMRLRLAKTEGEFEKISVQMKKLYTDKIVPDYLRLYFRESGAGKIYYEKMGKDILK